MDSVLSRPAHILTPIVFFDCFDYPLTATEVWKYAWGEGGVAYDDVVATLDALEKRGMIESGNGFWFLKGRSGLIQTRNWRHAIAYRKWRRTLRVVRMLRRFPFIRFVGVANTLAYDNAAEESDIDLFFVTARDRVWTARFFVTLFLKLFGLRPRPQSKRDKICSCFWVDETAMDLSLLALTSETSGAGAPKFPQRRAPVSPITDAIGDLYFHYWIATLWPVWDPVGLYEQFFNANAWVRERLPNIHPIKPNRFREITAHGVVPPARRGSKGDGIFQRVVGSFISVIPERWLRSMQERAFPRRIREQLSKGTSVVANDHVLKFHVDDQRREIRDRVEEQTEMIFSRHSRESGNSAVMRDSGSPRTRG